MEVADSASDKHFIVPASIHFGRVENAASKVDRVMDGADGLLRGPFITAKRRAKSELNC